MTTASVDERAAMSAASINDLPDSAFAYIEPGGTKDDTGRTVPRSKRHFPIHDAAHVRNALARASQSPYGAKAMGKIRAAAKKYGVEVADTQRSAPSTFVRGFDFEMRSAGGDGRTLEGYVAMFHAPARIPDRGGDFDEELHPGFADRSLAKGFPVMQYDHGKCPRVGTVPIGVYDTFDKDNRGYFVRARLFDNPVVEPVRQAIAGQAIKGMSFRFSVSPDGGDRWTRTSGRLDKRDILDADIHEAGPVVFPAYAQTSVTVRSLLASASDEELRALVEELRQALGLATDLTGRSDTWRADGGETHDEEPQEGRDASPVTPPQIRDRLLRMALRPEIRVPS